MDADDIVIDAKSGATGAGRAAREDLLFCEVDEDLKAYSPGRTHRHVGEMEAVLADRTGRKVALTFCPHLLPLKRGILSALYVKTRSSDAELSGALERAYSGSPFVKVVAAPPRLSEVVGTNDCRISVHAAAPGRAVVFSALDNLVKGAAGQAVRTSTSPGRPGPGCSRGRRPSASRRLTLARDTKPIRVYKVAARLGSRPHRNSRGHPHARAVSPRAAEAATSIALRPRVSRASRRRDDVAAAMEVVRWSFRRRQQGLAAALRRRGVPAVGIRGGTAR